MPSDINACFEAFNKANNQLDRLAEPCRVVVIAYSAWGIIENGGFPYFFEMNFDGDPPYEVFTEAFRRVGLEEIAIRFSQLVELFPFEDPHQSRVKRQEFLKTPTSSFSTAMTELEDLLYRYENIDDVLNNFLQASGAQDL